MDIKAEHQRQMNVAHWIDSHLSCEYKLPSRSLQLAHPCFDLVVEHHAAICLLEDANLFGSMYALIRIQFEALVNGLWLRHVATGSDIKKYEKDSLKIRFGTKINLIEQELGVDGGGLSYLKKEQWEIFCSFTHSGYQAVVRRIGEIHTGPSNYKPPEIIAALRQSGLFAVVAAVELASIVGDQSLVEETMNFAKSYGEKRGANLPS